MHQKNENPAVVGGVSINVRAGVLNKIEITTPGLPEQCRKQLYMRLYYGGVINNFTLSLAFAANPSWRSA